MGKEGKAGKAGKAGKVSRGGQQAAPASSKGCSSSVAAFESEGSSADHVPYTARVTYRAASSRGGRGDGRDSSGRDSSGNSERSTARMSVHVSVTDVPYCAWKKIQRTKSMINVSTPGP